MNPLLKRILVNGSITAVMLAVIGVGYAELAGQILAAEAPMRATVEVPHAGESDAMTESLQSQVPLMMAAWGFLFVAVGEVVMNHFSKKKLPALTVAPQPDPAMILLEEIMAKVESERATVAADSSPSATPAENTPVAS